LDSAVTAKLRFGSAYAVDAVRIDTALVTHTDLAILTQLPVNDAVPATGPVVTHVPQTVLVGISLIGVVGVGAVVLFFWDSVAVRVNEDKVSAHGDLEVAVGVIVGVACDDQEVTGIGIEGNAAQLRVGISCSIVIDRYQVGLRIVGIEGFAVKCKDGITVRNSRCREVFT
jgi:hypothetical protein